MSNELASFDEKEVSLRNIKTELAELIELREDTEHDAVCSSMLQDGIPCDCERGVIENRIKQYVKAELRKVDNIRAYWRYLEDMLASAQRDKDDADARARSWANQFEFLKSLCIDLMGEFKEKKLHGDHGFIRMQPNGGSLPLDIYSLALIPEELVLYRGWMSAEAMAAIPPEVTARQDFQFEREPKNGTIKAILETKCPKCNGLGVVAVKPVLSETAPCQACSSTGRGLVAGARLGPRGNQVRIR